MAPIRSGARASAAHLFDLQGEFEDEKKEANELSDAD